LSGRSLGAFGEDVAARWLTARGIQILDRNWRSGRSELDLIAREGDVIAFIEVKTRRPGPQSPVEAVSGAKRRAIRRASAAWIHSHPGVGREFRFDILGISIDPPEKPKISYIADAFTADDW